MGIGHIEGADSLVGGVGIVGGGTSHAGRVAVPFFMLGWAFSRGGLSCLDTREGVEVVVVAHNWRNIRKITFGQRVSHDFEISQAVYECLVADSEHVRVYQSVSEYHRKLIV